LLSCKKASISEFTKNKKGDFMRKCSIYHSLTLIILTAVIFFTTNTKKTFAYSSSNTNIVVELDDKILNLKANPILKDNLAFIPLREIANIMNIFVDWKQNTQTIVCTKGDLYQTFVIGSYVMTSSEEYDVILDTPPILIDGTTYVSLKTASHAFDSDVYWDDELQTVFIYSPIKTEDAVLSSKLTKLSLYIYAINNTMCLDKGSYMELAKTLKPEYAKYSEEFKGFSQIFDNDSEPPFGKININYSNINSYEMKKAKKVLNLSEDSVDVLISEVKDFSSKTDCKIPSFADYMSDIILYEKYIENYTVSEVDETLDSPYIFKKKYAWAEKPYNKHIKKMTKFKEKYFSEDSEQLIPSNEKLQNAENDIEKILNDLKSIYVNLGISGKTIKNPNKIDIKPLIKADLELTVYLKNFINLASDLTADKNGKTLKQKYSDYQSKYNSLYIKTLETYSNLFKLDASNPSFSTAFDTIIRMNNSQITNCVNNIKQLLNEWKFLSRKMEL